MEKKGAGGKGQEGGNVKLGGSEFFMWNSFGVPENALLAVVERAFLVILHAKSHVCTLFFL